MNKIVCNLRYLQDGKWFITIIEYQSQIPSSMDTINSRSPIIFKPCLLKIKHLKYVFCSLRNTKSVSYSLNNSQYSTSRQTVIKTFSREDKTYD